MFDSKEMPDLESELGPIAEKEQVCPGVYFLSAKNDDELLSRDYYAVMEKSLIPLKAKSYGRKLSGLWLFSLNDGSEEYKIIQYEVAKYRAQNHLPLDEPLRATAFFAAQSFPDYFGVFPVPLQTPKGCTTRHWILDNGIYWIETDQCEEVLAVCYPVWSSELSNIAEKLGEQTEYDKSHNIENTLGYIFFPMKISCIPLYELMRKRLEWAGIVIDKPALMNALWDTAPEYVCLINQQEQSGKNDLFSALLMELGIEVEPNISLDNVITIFPNAGKNFLLLKKDKTICQSRAD
ncbi:MAG: hypothetical protein K2O18_07800 [Oscillospiraceae bacterium]|nr:hypothetical protein [Oscillospiraceae bacterium]